MSPDLLEQRLTALANTNDDSDWDAVRRNRWRPSALALATTAFVLAALGAGAAFGLYAGVLPFGSQQPAPAAVVKDFKTFFGSEGAPPGMDPHVLAGEARRVASFAGGKYTLYVAPTKTGGFCESFTHLFGGCRQMRALPPSAPPGGPDELNRYAIGSMGEVGSQGTTILGGDLLLPPGTSLAVQFADGSAADIPVTFVSPPIDAGFFLYLVPAEHVRLGHEAIYLTARREDGTIVANARVQPHFAPPGLPLRDRTTKRAARSVP
jgi:hypothetical protein